MEFTETIKAHVFKSEESAKEALKTINKGEGIPINEEATTKTHTEVLSNEGMFYIVSDVITIKYLGDPETLKIKYTHQKK